MASLVQRIQQFLHTPKGQRLIAQAQQQAAKPANQQRLRRLLGRFTNRR